jgi:hypothetical protein
VGIVLLVIWLGVGVAFEYPAVLSGGRRYFSWGGWTSFFSLAFHAITGVSLLALIVVLLVPGDQYWPKPLTAVSILSGGVYMHLMSMNFKSLAQACAVYADTCTSSSIDVGHQKLVDVVLRAADPSASALARVMVRSCWSSRC